MLKHPFTGRAKGRTRFASALAGSALLAGALAPVAADAAFSTAACGGSAITGRGASFQAGAQQGFITNFQSADFCGSGAPGITYEALGSGAGRRSFGERSGANATLGNRDNAVRIAASDEPPTATQTLQMEKGPIDGSANDIAAADDGDLHVIPVAVGANAITVNFPDGCTPPAASLSNAPAESTKRVKIPAAKLEAAFYYDTTADTWGELLNGVLTGTPTDALVVAAGISDCNLVPVRRVVRADDSGTTFAQKDWLNKVKGDRSPAWTTFTSTPNTTWPNAVAESTANPCPVASNLCKNTSNGNGPLLDRLNTTDGGIGYSDVSTARSKGFEVSSVGDDTFWAPIVQTNNTAYEPTSDPTSYRTNVGVRGSNCTSTAFASVPDSTLGSWATVSGTGAPAAAFYPICTLTYALAWDDYAPVYASFGSAAENEAKARTVKDYLTSMVSSLGQASLPARDYSPLPVALRTLAQNGVAAIGFDKTATGGGTTTTPTTTTPTTTTPTTATTPPVTTTPAAPSNVFTIASSRVNGTNLVLSIQVPGAGKLQSVATAKVKGKTVKVGTVTATASAAGTVKLTVKASAAAKKLLKKSNLKVTIKLTYTPAGGTAASKSKTLTLKKAKAKKKK